MLGLKPIKMLPARERVAAALRKAIISRQITEGEVLTLESTAQELGVSITPVREAFQILERDGLIDLQQNKGATVLGINETTLREHFQIRAALESEACVLCCKNRIDMSRIEQVLTVSKEMIEKQDYENYSKLNQSLHMEIWIAAGNEKLKKMLSELWSGLSMGVKYAKKSLKEHEGIVESMKKCDTMEAAMKMHQHIERSLEDVLTEFEK